MTEQNPTTVAGAIRAHLALAIPELPVYRNDAPEGTSAPVAVIIDGLSTSTETFGQDMVLKETVQVDLYTNTGDDLALPDDLHAALHGAPIWLPRSQVYRVSVTERSTDPETDNDGLTRTIFTVTVLRKILSVNDPNQPLPPREPAPSLLAQHAAQTTDVHGIANTAELETQTGAQAKADTALQAANDYTDNAVANIDLPDNIETTDGAQAKADAAQAAAGTYTDTAVAAAITEANTYTDNAIENLELPANLETTEGAQAKADAAQTAAQNYADSGIIAHVGATDPHGDRAYANSTFVPASQKGQANGVATLGATGKIPSNQISALYSTEVYTVASQAAMLALSAQSGDVARRTDISTTFILAAEPATDVNNWVIFLTPPDAVLSVDGRVGSVSLSDRYDASGAASAALVTAKAYSDAAEAEAISVSEGYTDTQVAGAISTAAADATTKANAAQAAAILTAATDATTKANAAQAAAISAAATDATTKANGAQSAAISAAATDATTKANNAQSAAISAAATDATTKADAAQAAAIAAAATDATTKANTARTAAIADAATKYATINDAVIGASAAGATNLTLQEVAGQSANPLVVKTSAGASAFIVTATGSVTATGNGSVGNGLAIGSSAPYTPNQRHLAIQDAVAAPTTNPTGGVVAYSDTGRLKVRDDRGINTVAVTTDLMPGAYAGDYNSATAYPINCMVTQMPYMYAARAAVVPGNPPVVTSVFNANMTGTSWTRNNTVSVSSPTVTMTGSANTIASVINNSTTIPIAPGLVITQQVDVSVGNSLTAETMFFGFTTQPANTSNWSGVTSGAYVRFGLGSSASLIATVNGVTSTSFSQSSFANNGSYTLKLVWTFGTTNTTVAVYQGATLLTTLAVAAAVSTTTVRDALQINRNTTTTAANYTRTADTFSSQWRRITQVLDA